MVVGLRVELGRQATKKSVISCYDWESFPAGILKASRLAGASSAAAQKMDNKRTALKLTFTYQANLSFSKGLTVLSGAFLLCYA
jgi:hypothetical protein